MPVRVGDTVYVRGTTSFGRAFNEWPDLLTGIFHGDDYRAAFAMAQQPGVTTVVGHSLGAAYATDIATRLHKSYRGYGAPKASNALPGDHANLGDPVTWFNWGSHHAGKAGHSVSSYLGSGR